MAFVVSTGDQSILSSGAKVFLINSIDGTTVKSVDISESAISLPVIPKPREDGTIEKVTQQDPSSVTIYCSCVSPSNDLIAFGTSSKTVVILEVATLALKRAFRIPKAPTSISFDKIGSHVIVGDRAGHVCRYSVAAPEKVGYKDISGEVIAHEGEPLTGAISMVLEVAVSNDGKYLLVADRDEKLRVSRYPLAYVIQSFCLGHNDYVKSVASSGTRVFTSGGDCRVIEWDVEGGQQIAASERLHETLPLRKIIAVNSNVLAVVEGSSDIHILQSAGSQLLVQKVLSTSSPILDLTVSGNNVVCVSRSFFIRYNVESHSIQEIPLPSDLLPLVSECKDAIESYFKNVTHQNMEEYHKRKIDKMEKDKEKKQRKRRALKEAAAAKKVHFFSDEHNA